MNSLELRSYIGSLRGQDINGTKTKEELITELQSIDWGNVEELEFCPLTSLQTVVNNFLTELNQR